jgi:WD40 repeat protein
MSAAVYCVHCGALNQPEAGTCFACGRSLDEPAPVIDARRVIGGRYRLVRQLGVGGFGAVYQAEDTMLGHRLVALKEMSPRGLSPQEAREATDAFQREALLLAGLAHPSLPRIYERFEEAGRWYLVMDFIEGETLDVYLDRQGGSVPVKEALQLALQLCDVLGYLHSRQPPIIFRDLKPSNIIRSPEGQVTLVDFGIARFFKPGQSKDTIAFGSPGYAAPEQYGKAQTTPRSDVFSLGAVLHQLLTGSDPSEKPFRFAPLTMPRPAGLSALIERMVDMDESRRPSSMETIRRELTALLDARTPWSADDAALRAALLSSVGTAIGARAATGPVAQSAGYSGPPLQPLQGSAAAQPAKKKKGKAGCLVGLAVAALLIWQIVSGIASHSTATINHGGLPTFLPTNTAVPWESATEMSSVTPTAPSAPVPVYSVAWSPDGKYIASGGADGMIAVRDVTAGTQWKLNTGAPIEIDTLAWSPNGRYLAVGISQVLQIWDTEGKLYRGYYTAAGITSLSWSPDNEHLVLGSAGGQIQITDMVSEAITILVAMNSYPVVVAWSPDGKYIAAGGVGQPIKIWQSATHEVIYTDQSHQATITAFAWSPDGKHIASAGYDPNSSTSYVEDWDALTGANTVIYGHDTYNVHALAWSPDGSRIADGDDNGTIGIWYEGSLSTSYISKNQGNPLHALAWSPDSSRIASASMDGTVQVWDALTGNNRITYNQP